jgi:excisionase family DNA binding protein
MSDSTAEILDPAEILDRKLFADVPETAEILRYDQRTVRRAIEAGEIPAVRAGGRWRIPTSWLRAQAQVGGSDGTAA